MRKWVLVLAIGGSVLACLACCLSILASTAQTHTGIDEAQEVEAGSSAPYPSQVLSAHFPDPSTGNPVGVLTIRRELGVIPYNVEILFEPAESASDSIITWDTDTSFDTDGDGDPSNDADATGPSLALMRISADEFALVLSIGGNPATAADTTKWQVTIPRLFCTYSDPIAVDIAGIANFLETDTPAVQDAVLKQRHMDALDLEYITEFDAAMSRSGSTVLITTPEAGRYVFSATIGDVSQDVIIWTYKNVTPGKQLWLFMQDIWNNSGNPWDSDFPKDTPFFSDDEIVAKVDFLHSNGIVNIGFAQNLRYSGLDPIGFERWNHSIPDEDLKWLLELLTEPEDARVFVQLQTIIDPNWGVTIDDLRNFIRQPGNAEQAFRSYAESVRGLTDALAPFHIDYLDVHATAPLTSINEMAGPLRSTVIDNWIDVLADVESSGAVGVQDFIMGAGLGEHVDTRYLSVADFYIILVFNNAFCGASDCSVGDVVASMSHLLDEITMYSRTAPAIESFFVFNPRSNVQGLLGQMPAESGGQWQGTTSLDYRAQVRALEGTLVAFLQDPDMQNAMVSPEYWKMLDFSHFLPRNWLERQIRVDATLQGKPAFHVFELYNSMINCPARIQAPELKIAPLKNAP